VVPDDYIAASTKAMSSAEVRQFEAMVRGIYKAMARICVAPGWARYPEFGSGRVPARLKKRGNQS